MDSVFYELYQGLLRKLRARVESLVINCFYHQSNTLSGFATVLAESVSTNIRGDIRRVVRIPGNW